MGWTVTIKILTIIATGFGIVVFTALIAVLLLFFDGMDKTARISRITKKEKKHEG